MEYNYVFKIFDDGTILETLKSGLQSGLYREEVYKRLLDARDEGIRKTLIELGWTPPEKGPSSSHLQVFPTISLLNENKFLVSGVHINVARIGGSLYKNILLEHESDLTEVRGTMWDSVWIHPDVKWGLAKEALKLERK